MPARIPDKIPCDSLSQLEGEAKAFIEGLAVAETEETWDKIEHAFARFTAIIKGGGYKFEKELVNALKSSSKGFVGAMTSERTRLAIVALECLGAIAPRIGVKFETLVAIYVPPLLRLSTRTNKVYVTRSQTTTALIVGYCQIPSIVPHLLTVCKESKMATGRLGGGEATLRALKKWDWTLKDTRAKVTDIEEILRLIGRDKDPAVRQTSKKIFEAYEALFPERVNEFAAPLTPTMKKYLDIKASGHDRPTSTNLLACTSSAKPFASNALRLDLRDECSRAMLQKLAGGAGLPSTKSVNNHASSMPPPATVPSRLADAQSPTTSIKDPSPDSSEEDANEVRQRAISNASSTFSVKSAPSNSRAVVARKPPLRLAVSQSGPNLTAVASGPARRVRRVISIEPHPANQSDLFVAARKVNGGAVPRSLNHDDIDSKQIGAVTFPKMGGKSGGPIIERKGAQRVLRPAPLPPASIGPKSSTEDASKPVHSAPMKEIEPSAFRRGVSAAIDKNKSLAEDKGQSLKEKEGFVPRKGGLTQPTLSQLNKQRTRVMSVTATKKPGIASKPSTLKTKPKRQLPKTPGTGNAPEPADASRSVTPHLVPLLSSPAMTPPPEKKEISVQGSSEVLEDDFVSQSQTQRTDCLAALPDQNIQHDRPQPAGDCQEAVVQPSCEETRPLPSAPIQRTPTPRTPPFPGTDHADESHELDHIEFIKGEAYDPAGLPVKTPRKPESQFNEDTANRIPLGEVIFNE